MIRGSSPIWYCFKDIIRGRLEVLEVDADHRGMLEGPAASRVYEMLSRFVVVSEPVSNNVVPLQPSVEQPRAQAN